MGRQRTKHDPLYRIIPENDEARVLEGAFGDLFNRLRRIANLGLIPQILSLPKYPKHEHSLGTGFQVQSLLRYGSLPKKYHRPLKAAAHLLHIGHFPFTYSTSKAVLLAGQIDSGRGPEIQDWLENQVRQIAKALGWDQSRMDRQIEQLGEPEAHKHLYRLFSASACAKRSGAIRAKFDAMDEDELKIVIENLADTDSDGYKWLTLANQADYIQRDGLYMGTIKLDLSPLHLYSKVKPYNPSFPEMEARLVSMAEEYLRSQFYDHEDVVWFDALYTKYTAALIRSSRFNLDWLLKMTDDEFQALLSEDMLQHKHVNLPSSWVKRMADLLNGGTSFQLVLDLKRNVALAPETSHWEIEATAAGVPSNKETLLKYHEATGLLVVATPLPDKDGEVAQMERRPWAIRVFREEKTPCIAELLELLQRLNLWLGVEDRVSARHQVAQLISRTGEAELQADEIGGLLARAVAKLDAEAHDSEKGSRFSVDLLLGLQDLKRPRLMWENPHNSLWLAFAIYAMREQQPSLHDDGLDRYVQFLRGLLSMPTQVLASKAAKKAFQDIGTKLREFHQVESFAKDRGRLLEAQLWMKLMQDQDGKSQLMLPGFTEVDSSKPRAKRFQAEFDLVSMTLVDGRVHCDVYECTTSKDTKKDKDKLASFADHLKEVDSSMRIRTWIVTLGKTSDVKIQDAGRGYE